MIDLDRSRSSQKELWITLDVHWSSLSKPIQAILLDHSDGDQALLKEKERKNKSDRLNSIREEIIQELANQEKQLMDNAVKLVLGEAWTKSKESLEEVNLEIASVFGEDKY